MRKLRNLAAALFISVVLSSAAIAGDMQGPGYTPPPPASSGDGVMGSPGVSDPVDTCCEESCETSNELSAAESLILGLLTAFF